MEKDRPQPEEVQRGIINLEKYGYKNDDHTSEMLARRLQEILQKGPKTIIKETTDIFGSVITAYSAKAVSETELKSGNKEIVNQLKQGTFSPTEDNLVRLAISLDYVKQMKDTNETDNTIRGLYIGSNPIILERNYPEPMAGCIAAGLNLADPSDLKSVHSICDAVVYNYKNDVWS